MDNSRRIIANTFAMYAKMIASLFVTFFTTRLILQYLGVVDFGIYNLIAGGVSLLGFLNGAMSNTIQRFLAFDLGADDYVNVSNTFSISFYLHLFCSFCVLFLLEILGSFLFDHVFVIDLLREPVARIVYHFVVIITAISVITTPFNACFNAHEHIASQALIDFIITVFKLFAAIFLGLASYDKLQFYVILLLCIQIADFLIKWIYCVCYFQECRNFSISNISISSFKDMFQFLIWNMIESFSWLTKGQGIAVIMNTFYGTIINASYGIANQVNGQLQFFSSSLLNSFRPQIYKKAGSREYESMLGYTIIAAKTSYYLLLIMFCPTLFVLHDFLTLWLKEVPVYAEGMCLILLFITLTNLMSTAINVVVQATGEIRQYQIVSSIIILTSLPIGYYIYSHSSNVYLFLYIMVFVEYISVFVKFKIASNVLGKHYLFFVKRIFVPCTISLFLCGIISYANYSLQSEFYDGLLLDGIFCVTDVILVAVCIFLCGINGSERAIIQKLIKSKI